MSDYDFLIELFDLMEKHPFDAETADIAKDVLSTSDRIYLVKRLGELYKLLNK